MWQSVRMLGFVYSMREGDRLLKFAGYTARAMFTAFKIFSEKLVWYVKLTDSYAWCLL